MKSVQNLITDTLQREGWPAFTDRPSDAGGPTKGGVTLTTYNAWRAQQGLAPITVLQLRNLPEGDARAFYADVFTAPFVFVGDEGIQALLIDWAITSGQASAITALQHALQPHGYAGAADGIPGPQTRAAWAAIESDFDACHEIETALVKARIEFFLHTALDESQTLQYLAAHPTAQLHNLRGWIRRGLEFLP